MRIMKLDDILRDPAARKKVRQEIVNGKVFIYPTDTIYGIGCDATNKGSVRKIRTIKKSKQPFSVIAPSKEWIIDNLEVTDKSYLDRLPGPYTLIFRMRRSPVCKEVSEKTLGVRIPDNPFTEIISEAGMPFVTTSVNLSGEAPLTDIREIPGPIRNEVDIVIDSGVFDNGPSTVIDLSGSKPRILRQGRT